MAPKKRPGKHVGLPKGSPDKPLEWNLSPTRSRPRSMFQLRTRTTRGRHNRSVVFERAQHVKNELIKRAEELQEPILDQSTKSEKSVLGHNVPKDPLTEYAALGHENE